MRFMLSCKQFLICAIYCFLVIGCTTKDPLFCDEQSPCPEGQTCNKNHTCEPSSVDAGPPRDARADRGSADLPDSTLALANGAACSADERCESKICADGVCCNSRCEGPCRTCALIDKRGECALAREGEDPRQDCAGSHSTCAGSCDGHGVCAFPADETSCEPTLCSDGELTLSHCSGAGECETQHLSCGGYACDATGAACRQAGGTVAECTGTFQCVGPYCVNQLSLGESCGENDLACDSTHCVDRVCCQTDSCAPCNVCNRSIPVGQCAPQLDGTGCGQPSCRDGIRSTPLCSSGSCDTVTVSCSPYACNAAGADCLAACGQPQDCAPDAYCELTHCLPKKANGQGCTADQECLSSICTGSEGVCCDSACAGECETCAGLSQCTPRPDDTPCGALVPFCDDTPDESQVKIEQCDGYRNCVAETITTCDPYRCTGQGGGAACATSCAVSSECTSGLCDPVDLESTCVEESKICYVTPTGSATCPGDGTQADPHCAIQLCLNSLKAYVALADGTYPENLIVMADVHLISTGTTSTSPKAKLLPPGSALSGLDINGGHTAYLYGLDLSFPAPSVPPLSSDPGGPLINTDNAEVFIKASRIHRGNKAPCLLNKSSTLTLTDVTIDTCGKRGISSEATELTLKDVLLFQNTEFGIYHDEGPLTMEGVTFRNNSGVSLLTYGAHLSLDRIRAYANDDMVFSLNNSTTGLIANMLAHDNAGSTLVLSNNAAPPLILHLTSSTNTGVEISCDNATTIYNSILWDTDNVMYEGNCNFSFSAVKHIVSGLNNILDDPLFNTNASEPYSLSSNSPCIDAASNTAPVVDAYPALDLAGNPRQVDILPGGKTYDMGAFELQ